MPTNFAGVSYGAGAPAIPASITINDKKIEAQSSPSIFTTPEGYSLREIQGAIPPIRRDVIKPLTPETAGIPLNTTQKVIQSVIGGEKTAVYGTASGFMSVIKAWAEQTSSRDIKNYMRVTGNRPPKSISETISQSQTFEDVRKGLQQKAGEAQATIPLGTIGAIAGGIAQVVPTVVLAAITERPYLIAGLFTSADAGGIYQDARDAGYSAEDALKVVAVYSPVAITLDKLGLDAIFGKFTKKAVFNQLSSTVLRGVHVATGAAGEAITEPWQTGWENIIASHSYDKARNLLDSVYESFIGGLAGGGVSAGVISRMNKDSISQSTKDKILQNIQDQLRIDNTQALQLYDEAATSFFDGFRVGEQRPVFKKTPKGTGQPPAQFAPEAVAKGISKEFRIASLNEKTLQPDGSFYIVKFHKSKATGKITVEKYIVYAKVKEQFVDATPIEKAQVKYQTNDPEIIANRTVNPSKDFNYQTEKYIQQPQAKPISEMPASEAVAKGISKEGTGQPPSSAVSLSRTIENIPFDKLTVDPNKQPRGRTIENIPFDKLTVDPSKQPREQPFAEATAAKIFKEGYSPEQSAKQPFEVWIKPNGTMEVLSGFSRFEGLNRRAKEGLENPKTIENAIVYRGITEEQARNIAARGNLGGTRQNVLDDAKSIAEARAGGRADPIEQANLIGGYSSDNYQTLWDVVKQDHTIRSAIRTNALPSENMLYAAREGARLELKPETIATITRKLYDSTGTVSKPDFKRRAELIKSIITQAQASQQVQSLFGGDVEAITAKIENTALNELESLVGDLTKDQAKSAKLARNIKAVEKAGLPLTEAQTNALKVAELEVQGITDRIATILKEKVAKIATTQQDIFSAPVAKPNPSVELVSLPIEKVEIMPAQKKILLENMNFQQKGKYNPKFKAEEVLTMEKQGQATFPILAVPSGERLNATFRLEGNKEKTFKPFILPLIIKALQNGKHTYIDVNAGGGSSIKAIPEMIKNGLRQATFNFFDKEKFLIERAIQKGEVSKIIDLLIEIDMSFRRKVLQDLANKNVNEASPSVQKIAQAFLQKNPAGKFDESFVDFVNNAEIDGQKIPAPKPDTKYYEAYRKIIQDNFNELADTPIKDLKGAVIRAYVAKVSVRSTGKTFGQGFLSTTKDGGLNSRSKAIGNFMGAIAQDEQSYQTAKGAGVTITLKSEDGKKFMNKEIAALRERNEIDKAVMYTDPPYIQTTKTYLSNVDPTGLEDLQAYATPDVVKNVFDNALKATNDGMDFIATNDINAEYFGNLLKNPKIKKNIPLYLENTTPTSLVSTIDSSSVVNENAQKTIYMPIEKGYTPELENEKLQALATYAKENKLGAVWRSLREGRKPVDLSEADLAKMKEDLENAKLQKLMAEARYNEIRRVLSSNTAEKIDELATVSPTASEFSQRLKDMTAESEASIKSDLDFIREIAAMNENERNTFMDVVEQKVVPVSGLQQNMVIKWKELSDTIHKRALANGIDVGYLVKYFPHFVSKYAALSPSMRKFINEQGNLEKPRQYETLSKESLTIDPLVAITRYVEEANMRITGARYLGADKQMMKVALAKIEENDGHEARLKTEDILTSIFKEDIQMLETIEVKDRPKYLIDTIMGAKRKQLNKSLVEDEQGNIMEFNVADLKEYYGKLEDQQETENIQILKELADQASRKNLATELKQIFKNRLDWKLKNKETISDEDIKAIEQDMLEAYAKKVEMTAKLVERENVVSSQIRDSLRSRGEVLRRSGKEGALIADLIDEADILTMEYDAVDFSYIGELEKLSEEASLTLVDVVNGRMQPVSHEQKIIVDKINNLKKLMIARGLTAGIEFDTSMSKLKPEVAQSLWNTKNREDLAIKLAKENNLDVEQVKQDLLNALFMVKHFKIKQRKFRSEYDSLPTYLIDNDGKNVVSAWIHENNKNTVDASIFGDKKTVYDLLKKQLESGGNYQAALKMLKQIFGDTYEESSGIQSKLRTFQTIKNMTFSMITNLTEPVKTIAKYSDLAGFWGVYRVSYNMIRAAFSRSAKAQAKQYGGTGEMIDRAIRAQTSAGRLAQEYLRIVGFKITQQWANTVQVLTALDFMERNLKLVRENPLNLLARTHLESVGVDVESAIKNGLSDREKYRITAMENLDALPIGRNELPYNWHTETGKTATQFKPYIYKFAKILQEHVLKQAARGNFVPLVSTMAYAIALGIAAQGLKDLLKSLISSGVESAYKKKPTWKGVGIFSKDPQTLFALSIQGILNSGGIGLLSEFATAIYYTSANYMSPMISFVFGPTSSTAYDWSGSLFGGGKNVIGGTLQKLGVPKVSGNIKAGIRELLKIPGSAPALKPITNVIREHLKSGGGSSKIHRPGQPQSGGKSTTHRPGQPKK